MNLPATNVDPAKPLEKNFDRKNDRSHRFFNNL